MCSYWLPAAAPPDAPPPDAPGAAEEVAAIGPTLQSMTHITGGGWANDGPPFVWLDSKSILLVHDAAAKVVKEVIVERTPTVAILDLDAGKLTDVATLPAWRRGMS